MGLLGGEEREMRGVEVVMVSVTCEELLPDLAWVIAIVL